MIHDLLTEHSDVMDGLYEIEDDITAAYDLLATCLKSGHKILLCGNGGSAADCQHFAAELVGKWQKPRAPLPAIALTTDTSTLTAIANDFGYDMVFARQVQALGMPGDVLIGISTSGRSENVLLALGAARTGGLDTIFMVGEKGPVRRDSGLIRIPSANTARIQEAHSFVLHCWAEALDTLYE
jgi:phosphoheptose isomerase